MASFFLFLDKSAGEEPAGILTELLDDYDGAYSWAYVDRSIAIAIAYPLAKPEIQEDQDALHGECFFNDKQSGKCIVSDSRLDYRQELAGELRSQKYAAESWAQRL